MKITTLFSLVLFSLFTICDRAEGAATGVSLPPDSLRQVNQVTCGQLHGNWVPGEVRNGLFYSHQSRIDDLKRQAAKKRGRARQSLQRKISALNQRLRREKPSCKTIQPPTPENSKKIRFNLQGAVALSLGGGAAASGTASATSSSSTLYRISATGALQNAVVSGTPSLSKFLIAPNNKLYVVFTQKINLETSEPVYQGNNGCLLAEVSMETGLPQCVESEAEMINWYSTRKAIQFDSTGAIYYLATDYDINAGMMTSRTLLRRYVNGQTTSLINDNISIPDYVVLSDGTVILTGYTSSTSARWIRRISGSTGAVSNIATSTQATFLELFPDNNVYYGMTEQGMYGVRRFLTADSTLDPKMWIQGYSAFSTEEPYYSTSSLCTQLQQNELHGFCNYSGAYLRSVHTTSQGKVFVLAGIDGNRSLVQYYPELARPTTVIQQASVALSILDSLVVAGVDSTTRNRLTLIDTLSGVERDLLPNDDIEVYHIGYSTNGNRILFDGLRFSDNKYVIGQVDVASGNVLITPTGGTKLLDLQTF